MRVKPRPYYRARAPLRISLCGGGTDVSPYPEEHGGMVLSATVNQYAYVSLRPRRDSRLTLASLDYDMVAKYDHPRRVRFDGQLDLIKAVVKALKVRGGADLWTHSDAPPGSGLGSSSTMVVALIGCISAWQGRPLSGYEVAELAYRIERVDLGMAGGRQDQYAATFGGINFIEFHRDATVVNPLRIRADVLNELQYRLLLCYMGQTRQSARIIERQTESYREGNTQVVEALQRLKDETLEMKKALLLGDVDAMASCCTRRGRTRSVSTRGSPTTAWTGSTGWRARKAPWAARCRVRGGAATSCSSRASTASTAWRPRSSAREGRWCRSASRTVASPPGPRRLPRPAVAPRDPG